VDLDAPLSVCDTTGVPAALLAHGPVVLRRLTRADEAALCALLGTDVWNNSYLFGILHWFGLDGPRSRFTGAFVGGRLVGVLGEGRETHCWYASLSAGDPAVAAALAGELVVPRVEVLLGREDVVSTAVAALPETRVRRTARLILSISDDAMSSGRPAHPVRRATRADLPALVDLYEGYELDGYPTRRHVWRALEERIRRGAIWVLELDGRPVAARRVEASSPEVMVLGGLTVDPAYRGRDLSQAVRRASVADLARLGRRHCALRHVDNARVKRSELRDHAPWSVANLAGVALPRWRDLLGRMRARVSSWDRPCRRRKADFIIR
jgi:hypothetical protein